MKKLSLLLFTAMLLPAAFTPEDWLHRQRITVATPVTRVTLDRGYYTSGAAATFADLRVVRDSAEVPFLLVTAYAKRQTSDVPVRIVNKETRGGTLFVTLEFEARREPHNQVELEVSRADFRSQVTIEASDDGRQWATVRQTAYIFRYHTDDGQAAVHTTLLYPDSRRRFLRLAIGGWPNPSEFLGATVRRDASAEASRSEIWSAADPAAETKNRTSCMVLNTGTRAPRDTAQLTPRAGRDAFHRSVTVEQSSDGKAWGWLGAGAIYRVPGEESLTVTFPETQLPFQRLGIYQGDDAPVVLTGVKLLGVDRELRFRAEAAGTYWLYHGSARAAAPEYDLAKTAGEDFHATAKSGSLGAREANPGYKAPPEPVKPWTERFPGLLYGVLGAAVAGMGWMALRLLKTSETRPE
jgi:hypothetical protein